MMATPSRLGGTVPQSLCLKEKVLLWGIPKLCTKQESKFQSANISKSLYLYI